MKTLTEAQIEQVSGGTDTGSMGYAVGYGIGYVLGGGAGTDLGIWLHKLIND